MSDKIKASVRAAVPHLAEGQKASYTFNITHIDRLTAASEVLHKYRVEKKCEPKTVCVNCLKTHDTCTYFFILYGQEDNDGELITRPVCAAFCPDCTLLQLPLIYSVPPDGSGRFTGVEHMSLLNFWWLCPSQEERTANPLNASLLRMSVTAAPS